MNSICASNYQIHWLKIPKLNYQNHLSENDTDNIVSYKWIFWDISTWETIVRLIMAWKKA